MPADIEIWLDEKMSPEERTEMARKVAKVLHSDVWYDQYFNRVVGPIPRDEDM